MNQCGEAHFRKHIQFVVAGGSISTKADCDSGFAHGKNRSYSGSQLEVASRIMSYANAFFSHNRNILVIYMNTVSCQYWDIKQTYMIHQGNRCHSVFFLTVFYFRSGFCQVDMNRNMVGNGSIPYLF